MLEQKIHLTTSTESASVTRFPRERPRRLRRSENVRTLVRETELNTHDFIYPLFIVHGKDVRHTSLDHIERELAERAVRRP